MCHINMSLWFLFETIKVVFCWSFEGEMSSNSCVCVRANNKLMNVVNSRVSQFSICLFFPFRFIFTYTHTLREREALVEIAKKKQTQRNRIVTKQTIRCHTIFSRDVIYMTQNKSKEKNYNCRTSFDWENDRVGVCCTWVCECATMWRATNSNKFGDSRLYFWSRKANFHSLAYVISSSCFGSYVCSLSPSFFSPVTRT